MKKRNRIVFFVVVFQVIICLLYSCSFDKPRIQSLVSSEVLSLTDSIIEISMKVVVKNTNPVGVGIKKIRTKMYFENKIIGVGDLTKNFDLKANDTTQITFVAKLNISNLAELFPKLIASDSSLIEIDGEYTVQKSVFSASFSDKSQMYVHIKDEIKKAIESNMKQDNFIKIVRISPKSAGLDISQVDISLMLKNTYPFSYILKEVNLSIKMENSSNVIGNVTLDKAVTIDAKSEKQLSLVANMKNFDVFQNLGNILFGGARNVILTGYSTVQISKYSFQIPLKQKQSILP